MNLYRVFVNYSLIDNMNQPFIRSAEFVTTGSSVEMANQNIQNDILSVDKSISFDYNGGRYSTSITSGSISNTYIISTL